MQKKLWTMAVALMFCISASCGETENIANGMPRHEVSLSWGWAPFPALGESFQNASYGMVNTMINITGVPIQAENDAKHTFGVVNLDYGFHVTSALVLGLNLSFNQIHGSVAVSQSNIYNAGSYKVRQTNFCIMPTIKVNWYRKNHVAWYSRLSMGVDFQNRKVTENTATRTNNVVTGDISEYRMGDEPGKEKKFAFQVTFVGFEFGWKNIRPFMELGIGHAGIFQLGVRGRF